MGTLHGRKKRRLRALLIMAAVLLTIAAVIVFACRPLESVPPPAPTQSASPAPDTAAPTVSPAGAESPAASTPPEASPAAQPIEVGLSQYDAVLRVDAAKKILTGRLRLTYVNRYADSLFSVVLNLFPNAVDPGCLALEAVTVEGLDSAYTLSDDGAHLTVPLTRELKTGESTLIYIEYIVRVPETNNRFGIGKSKLMFGNCIPIAAVYENGAWRMDEYFVKGDSFYSEIADYRVSIAAPQAYTLACTGSVEEQRTEGGVTTVLAAAREVRDFAFSLHKNAYVVTREANGVEVVGVSDSQRGAVFAAANGADAILYFSEKLCAYPYERLCVVGFDTGGGMEYPGLVMVDASLLNSSHEEYAAMVVAHEVAHQWFYGIVGSDQLNEPWVDESLVEFLGLEFVRGTMYETIYPALWNYVFEGLASYQRTLRLDAPLSSFHDSDYFYVIYAYGAQVMRDLFDELGEDTFYMALQDYLGEHRYQNASGADLIAAFSEAAGKDMSAWFEAKIAP